MSVLVIIVSPPEWGDPIHSLRRQFSKDERGGQYLAGTIFTRPPARSEQAQPADLDMLQERLLKRSSRISVTVDWVAEPPSFQCVTPEPVASFVAEERKSLLEPLRPKARAPEPNRSGKTFQISSPERGGLSVVDFQELMRRDVDGDVLTAEERTQLDVATSSLSGVAQTVGNAIAALGMRPDGRTRSEFEEEVEEYCNKIAAWFHLQTLGDIVRSGGNALRLRVRNLTDRNFLGVVVQVHITGPVTALDRDELDFHRPRQPEPFGTPSGTPWSLFGIGSSLSIPAALTSPVHSYPARPRTRIDNSASATIRFAAVDVRPHGFADLDPDIVLLVGAGTDVALRWSVTASNVDGVVEGLLRADVTSETVDPDLERDSD